MAGISTRQLSLEEIALTGHVAGNFMRINSDSYISLCMAAIVVAHKLSSGYDAPPYTLKDAELSDSVIFIGTHPVLWGRIKEAKPLIERT